MSLGLRRKVGSREEAGYRNWENPVICGQAFARGWVFGCMGRARVKPGICRHPQGAGEAC